MVHEHVGAAQEPEEVGRGIGALEHDRGLRHPRLVLELGPVERVERPEPAEVEGAVDHVDVGVGQLELAAQQLEHLAGHLGVDLEPHDPAELAAPPQHRLDRLEEVLGFVLELEVGVARDPERVVREHLHAREQRVELRRDHLLEQHEALAVGERDEAGEQRRHLDPREALVAARRVAHGDREVERQVRDVGERVRGVDRERGEHREDRLGEELVEVGAVVVGELVPVGEADALRRRAPGTISLANTAAARVDELVDPVADGAELVDEVEAVGRGGAQPGGELLHQARRPAPRRTRRGSG